VRAAKHLKTYYSPLKTQFLYDGINKLQKQEPYMNLWMDPLGNLLTTRPIQAGWECTTEPYIG
jgi:hypothetical protein